MSGSGASVISFFNEREAAEKTASGLKAINIDSVLHTFS
ncbi:hypothetical protein [Maridesulfovibrio sp.]